jgi:hypothetical protein
MYFCTRCNRPMSRGRWGWFVHVIVRACENQFAYWAEVD